jgi:hypothetical protein
MVVTMSALGRAVIDCGNLVPAEPARVKIAIC